MQAHTHGSAMAVRRLKFAMPGFQRIAWTSVDAKGRWAPVLTRAQDQVRRILAALSEGTIGSAIIARYAFEIPATIATCIRGGHGWLVLGKAPAQAMADFLQPGTSGDHVWMAIGPLSRNAELKAWWDAGNIIAIAELLDLPACCAARASAYPSRVESEWNLALEASTSLHDPRTNYLLLRLGISPSLHLPCHPSCAATLARIGPSITGPDLRNILSWPMHWSALHGIAETLTPVLRLVHDTVPTADKHQQSRGHAHNAPAGTPVGVTFPYLTPATKPQVQRVSFQRGLQTARISSQELHFGEVKRVAFEELGQHPDEPALSEACSRFQPLFERLTVSSLQERFGLLSVAILRRHLPGELRFDALVDALFEPRDDALWQSSGPIMLDWDNGVLDGLVLPALLQRDHGDGTKHTTASQRWIDAGSKETRIARKREAHAVGHWSGLLRGRREWAICPPGSDIRLLERAGSLFDPVERARLSRRGLAILLCKQAPGQIVYVPRGWWYEVRNAEASIAIGESLWGDEIEIHHDIAKLGEATNSGSKHNQRPITEQRQRETTSSTLTP